MCRTNMPRSHKLLFHKQLKIIILVRVRYAHTPFISCNYCRGLGSNSSQLKTAFTDWWSSLYGRPKLVKGSRGSKLLRGTREQTQLPYRKACHLTYVSVGGFLATRRCCGNHIMTDANSETKFLIWPFYRRNLVRLKI